MLTRLSYTEENYLKAIYKLLEKGHKKIMTNSIAAAVETAPASVTDMLQKLAEKKLINYERYQGATLTSSGKKKAIGIIRKHRLWETFLFEKLGFSWDEVHEIAEQLEHIHSESLVIKLYDFLGRPLVDPHGDPIPDENGNFHSHASVPLSAAGLNEKLLICGVIDHRPVFLQYLSKAGLEPGKKISIKEIIDYDNSMKIQIAGMKTEQQISFEVAKNLLVRHE
jgi:DtxR family transcriptional regulator, Mn-dependent transcriptional regulator